MTSDASLSVKTILSEGETKLIVFFEVISFMQCVIAQATHS